MNIIICLYMLLIFSQGYLSLNIFLYWFLISFAKFWSEFYIKLFFFGYKQQKLTLTNTNLVLDSGKLKKQYIGWSKHRFIVVHMENFIINNHTRINFILHTQNCKPSFGLPCTFEFPPFLFIAWWLISF